MERLEERIKRLRREIGMSTTELGKKVHRPQSSISNIENGKTKLTIPDLSLFAEALGVTEYYLLTGISDENRTAAKELGLSQETILNIKKLNGKKKALLEMLINDEGLVLSLEDYKKHPELEPECGFMDALSDYVCDPAGNRIVDIVGYEGNGTEDNPFGDPIIRQAPHKLMIQLADGSLHSADEWQPDGKTLSSRLKTIRKKYLKNLSPKQYTPTDEEDDEK